jgi:hypothetical protein
VTKDKHDEVKTHLGNRIDWQRGLKAAKTHTKEQWTINKGLEWAMQKFMPAKETRGAVKPPAVSPRRSGRLAKKDDPVDEPVVDPAVVSNAPAAPLDGPAPQSIAASDASSRKGKATDEPQAVGLVPWKRPANENAAARMVGDALAFYDPTFDENGKLVAVNLQAPLRQMAKMPVSAPNGQRKQDQALAEALVGIDDVVAQWRRDVPAGPAKAPTSIASLSDRVSEISFEHRYPIPRNSSRTQRVQFLQTLRRRNREFGSARAEKQKAGAEEHKVGAEERKAEAKERKARLEEHVRDGEDAQLECRIQIELVDPEQPEEQEEISHG